MHKQNVVALEDSIVFTEGTIRYMTPTITTEELKAKMDAGEVLHLVDVLAPESFATWHVPGAKNIPFGPEFLEALEKETGADKATEVILYCSSATCEKSVHAAGKLKEAGYTNVVHYKDGLAGWKNAGHPLEGAASQTKNG